MKRAKHIYAAICDFENLYAAWRQARRGKRYQPSIATFELHLDDELQALHKELREERWQPGGYRSFTIHEPKRRKISAAPFRDRVVHHALCNVIEPLFEAQFIAHSYANRVGKGTHAALDRCTGFMRRFNYVLQCDVQQFFPAIDHAILKSLLARAIDEPAVLRLCGQIIDSGAGILNDQYTLRYFPGDDLFSANRPRGLPIGNLTSQFWANVYLNELDQFVKHGLRCPAYLRYVDDFLLFADDKKTLHEWREQIIIFLQSLRLTIHERRAQPRPVTMGLPFLGFTVYPTHRLLKNRRGYAYQRHLRSLIRGYEAQQVSLEEVRASVQGWINHVRYADSWGLRGHVFDTHSIGPRRAH